MALTHPDRVDHSIPFAFALPASPPVCAHCGGVEHLWVWLSWTPHGSHGAYGTLCACMLGTSAVRGFPHLLATFIDGRWQVPLPVPPGT